MYYLRKVQKELREVVLDHREELLKAYEALAEALRMSFEQERPDTAVKAQRAIIKLLGLHKTVAGAGFNPETVRDQMQEMLESIGEDYD